MCVKLEISCIQITAIELLCAVLIVYCVVRGFQTFVAADLSIYYLDENDSLKLPGCLMHRLKDGQWLELEQRRSIVKKINLRFCKLYCVYLDSFSM